MAVVLTFPAVRICIFVVLMLGISSGCTSPREQPAAPEKTNVSKPPAPPAPPQPEDHRSLIVTFGDSLSAGYGADPGKSYPDFLQKLLDQNHLPYRVYNAGVSGDTTTDGVERMPEILTLKPKITILELGGNDGLRGLPITTTRANMEKIIVALRGAGSQVILAGMTLPRNYGPEYIHAFEQIYPQLAAQYHLRRIP